LLAFFGGSLLLVNGKSLIRLWVGSSLVSSYSLVVVLALAYMVQLSQHTTLLVSVARVRHALLGWWNIVEGIANVLLSLYWASKWGLMGVALGTAVPMIISKIVIQPYYALRAVRVSARQSFQEGLARPL